MNGEELLTIFSGSTSYYWHTGMVGESFNAHSEVIYTASSAPGVALCMWKILIGTPLGMTGRFRLSSTISLLNQQLM